MGSKRTIAVLFGGRSAEHDVSIMSATNVMQAIDRQKYDVAAIKIERDGRCCRRPRRPLAKRTPRRSCCLKAAAWFGSMESNRTCR